MPLCLLNKVEGGVKVYTHILSLYHAMVDNKAACSRREQWGFDESAFEASLPRVFSNFYTNPKKLSLHEHIKSSYPRAIPISAMSTERTVFPDCEGISADKPRMAGTVKWYDSRKVRYPVRSVNSRVTALSRPSVRLPLTTLFTGLRFIPRTVSRSALS